jgi:two-component system chemotaxis sensor kinase CheA
MLINDVLDLSKIEAGKIDLRLANESVKQIQEDMKSLFAEVANQKKINFTIEINPGVPEFIVTDKLRIEQIIKNLLSNAFKFTGVFGAVKFTIKRPDRTVQFKNQHLQFNPDVLEFSVTDSGIGIPLEQQQIIFEAFQQADGSINRKYGGTGLGLSISRMLVNLLGGELQLVSEKDKGSTFFLFVPVKSGQVNLETVGNQEGDKPVANRVINEEKPEVYLRLRDTAFAQATATKSVNKLSRKIYETLRHKKVLIVDDDMRNIYALTSCFENQGMSVVVAIDGKDAVIKTDKYKQFDIVLIDTAIPEASIRDIRKRNRNESVPVIMLTGTESVDDKEKWKWAGAVDCISKRMDVEELLSLMSVWLYKEED